MIKKTCDICEHEVDERGGMDLGKFQPYTFSICAYCCEANKLQEVEDLLKVIARAMK